MPIVLIFYFRKILDDLGAEGHVYSTVDDDHFKSTDWNDLSTVSTLPSLLIYFKLNVSAY